MAASPSSEPKRLAISSRFGDYEVAAAPTLAAALERSASAGATWIIADQAILRLHGGAIRAACPPERIHAVPATEESKSFEALAPLLTAVLSSGFRRDCRLLAIGGGVIQDITAFLASILMRGVGWEFIPTTLLAQCDSCIGAKSSINIASFKNQLGSFHPPRRIHLCTGLLESLGEDAVRSGMGEILKFHLVEGGATWEAVRALPPAPSLDVLEGLVWRSLEIKRRYIEADELDTGIRAILNYGHTFGHAFESATAFGIPHGIAVALGMTAATYISRARGLVAQAHYDEVERALTPIYHPFQRRLAAVPIAAVLDAMRSDKKNTSTATYVILTRGPGGMHKVKVDLEREIAPVLGEFLTRISA